MTTENTIVNESTQELINTNLQTALAQVIDKTMQGVDASVSFLQQEIPDVIYQLLLWYGVKSAVIASVLVVASVIVVRFVHKHTTGYLKSWYSTEKQKWLGSCEKPILLGFLIWSVVGGGVLGTLVVASENALTALQIWIAPKIFLLDYASSFVK